MAVKFLTGNEAEAKIGKGVQVINVTANWCGPCQMMKPIFEELSKTVDVMKVDLDQNREWAQTKGVKGIPTTFIYKDGEKIDTIVGFAPKDVLIQKF